jgi:dimethylargininase
VDTRGHAPVAFTREVSDAIARCELTHLTREPIDLVRVRTQHDAYEAALGALGLRVCRLSAGADMADSVFIEDTAVVLPELAVIARPGAESRRAEVAAVAEALVPLRPIAHVMSPGTLDGGDVLVIGRSIFVGLSTRTNDAGIMALRAAVEPAGYAVTPMATSGCLHLKSAVTALDQRSVLVNRQWLPPNAFAEFVRIDIDPSEPHAANVLAFGGRLLTGSAHPRTSARLEQHGFAVTAVDVSELAKAEGALTCCSLLVP